MHAVICVASDIGTAICLMLSITTVPTDGPSGLQCLIYTLIKRVAGLYKYLWIAGTEDEVSHQ